MIRTAIAIAIAGIAGNALCLHAQQRDTLRPFDSRGAHAYYRDAHITAQVARFDLAAPASVQQVSLTLGGGTGAVTVHLYGAEGGAPAPMFGHDLTPPVVLTKRRAGVETLTAVFPRPALCNGPQFFVAVDHMAPGITFLSDTRRRQPACGNAVDDAYYGQLLRFADGGWRTGRCAFVAEAVVQYAQPLAAPWLADATRDAGLPDTVSRNGNIAVADVDANGTLDIVIDGRLYRNSGGMRFTDATVSAGLFGQPAANIVLDINNDLQPDILFVAYPGDTAASRLFVNNGDGTFTPRRIALPGRLIPMTYSVGDINGDGFVDLFIGSACHGGQPGGSMLLLNDGALGFADSSAWLVGPGGPPVCDAAQMIDYNNDALLDLHLVSFGGGPDALWEGRRAAPPVSVGGRVFSGRMFGGAGHGVAAAWADYDNDGLLDLLRPVAAPLAVAIAGQATGGGIARGTTAEGREPGMLAEAEPIEFNAGRSSGIWGDLDNNGLLDYLLASSSGCRYAALFVQAGPREFQQATAAYGLFRSALGPDAVIADLDGDGRLDIVALVDGRLRLLRNTRPATPEASYVGIDLVGQHALGARVTVWADGVRHTRDYTSGRGLLVQEPARIHIGLGPARAVASAVIRWGNGSAEPRRCPGARGGVGVPRVGHRCPPPAARYRHQHHGHRARGRRQRVRRSLRADRGRIAQSILHHRDHSLSACRARADCAGYLHGRRGARCHAG